MTLEEFSRHTKLDLLMYLERFVCQKFHHLYANYSEVSREFQPQNVYIPFLLPLVKSKTAQITNFGDDRTLNSIVKIGFPIHPDTITDLSQLDLQVTGELFVLPTCSTRTLLAYHNNATVFLKVSIERRISRIRRRVKPEDVKNDLYASTLIKNKMDKGKLPNDCAFLLQKGGAILTVKGGHIGVLARDTSPFPASLEGRYLVPIFSLYSRDQHRIFDQPLLVQLINKSGLDPLDYLIQNIACPLMRHFDSFARTLNIVLQPHAQNTLLELTEDFSILRVVHRDIPTRAISTDLRKENWPIHIRYSMMYDNYLCRDSLQLLGNILIEYYSIDRKKIIEAIKQCFKKNITVKDNFPKQEYSLPDKLMERSEPLVLSDKATYR